MAEKGRAAIVRTGKAAVAVAAPEAAVPLAVAEKALGAAKDILTGDIVVVRKTENVGTKKHPVIRETETHYNLLSAGLGALAVGAAAFVGVSAWEGRAGGLWFGPTPRMKDNYDRFLAAHPNLQKRLRLNRPG